MLSYVHTRYTFGEKQLVNILTSIKIDQQWEC